MHPTLTEKQLHWDKNTMRERHVAVPQIASTSKVPDQGQKVGSSMKQLFPCILAFFFQSGPILAARICQSRARVGNPHCYVSFILTQIKTKIIHLSNTYLLVTKLFSRFASCAFARASNWVHGSVIARIDRG